MRGLLHCGNERVPPVLDPARLTGFVRASMASAALRFEPLWLTNYQSGRLLPGKSPSKHCGSSDHSQDQRQGGDARCDGETRYGDAFEDGLAAFGQTLGVHGGEIDNKADDRARFMIAPQDANAAQFDHSGECFGWADQKPPAGGLQMDPIVADEPGETHGAVTR